MTNIIREKIAAACRATVLGAAVATTLSLASTAVVAQAKAADNYIYGTYHYCNTATQDRADEIMAKVNAPVWDAAVADGTVTSWGWVSHHTGGKWRRIQYHTAPTIEKLFAAQNSVGDKIEAANAKSGKEFSAICNAHDDYIWRTVAGGDASGVRGKAVFSVYYVCDESREGQADALVKAAFAPVYDKLVADGKLTSWGWHEHIVGGEFRRLSTMTATDVPALMKARGEVVQAFTDNALGDIFTGICGSHRDYIWEVKNGKP